MSIPAFENDRFLYRKGSFDYIIPQERSVDIDSILDFKLSEIIMAECNDH